MLETRVCLCQRTSGQVIRTATVSDCRAGSRRMESPAPHPATRATVTATKTMKASVLATARTMLPGSVRAGPTPVLRLSAGRTRSKLAELATSSDAGTCGRDLSLIDSPYTSNRGRADFTSCTPAPKQDSRIASLCLNSSPLKPHGIRPRHSQSPRT